MISLGLKACKEEMSIKDALTYVENGYNMSYHSSIDNIPENMLQLWLKRNTETTEYLQSLNRANSLANKKAKSRTD